MFRLPIIITNNVMLIHNRDEERWRLGVVYSNGSRISVLLTERIRIRVHANFSGSTLF